MNQNKEMVRLAVVALLVSVMFGIKEFVLPKTTDINIEFGMNIISSAFFSTALIAFVLYVFLLACQYCHHTKIKALGKLSMPFYDIGVGITFIVIVITVLLLIILRIFSHLPRYTDILVASIWIVIIISALLGYFTLKEPATELVKIIVQARTGKSKPIRR